MGFVYPLFGFRGFRPFAGDLPGGDVEAIPDIGHGDVEDDGSELGFAVMTFRFVPDVIGNGIAAVAEARDGLGEREGGAFGIGEVRRVSPGGNGEEALGAPVRLLEAKGHIQADAAAIDLAGAHVGESESLRGDSRVFRGFRQRLQMRHGI